MLVFIFIFAKNKVCNIVVDIFDFIYRFVKPRFFFGFISIIFALISFILLFEFFILSFRLVIFLLRLLTLLRLFCFLLLLRILLFLNVLFNFFTDLFDTFVYAILNAFKNVFCRIKNVLYIFLDHFEINLIFGLFCFELAFSLFALFTLSHQLFFGLYNALLDSFFDLLDPIY